MFGEFRSVNLLLAGLLVWGIGCGGGDAPTGIESTGGGTTVAPSTPSAAPSSGGMMAPPTVAVPANVKPSGGNSGPVSTSGLAPDATATLFLQSIRDNKLELVWDLLPASYQTGVNGLFREFGKNVDAEVWDKSFNLINRYVSAYVSKEEMFRNTPAYQQQMDQFKAMMGASNAPWLTPEKLEELSKPINDALITLLNSEISSKKRLETFDGKVFFAKSLSPIVKKLTTAGFQFASLAKESAKDNPDVATAAISKAPSSLDEFLQKVQFEVQNNNGMTATLIATYEGEPSPPLVMQNVEGKWVPQQMAMMMPMVLQQGKMFAAMGAGQVNSVKDRVVPVLAEIEPLVDALQKAKTQDEFNSALAALQTTGAQKVATAMGMPGLGSALGGGSVSISKVEMVVNQKLEGEPLAKLIGDLEQITDDPTSAILLPNYDGEKTVIAITPVANLQAFIDKITFAEVIDVSPAEKKATLKVASALGTEPAATDAAPAP